jgi:hypothetical protein
LFASFVRLFLACIEISAALAITYDALAVLPLILGDLLED